jgi:Cu(I)/Ag(I) efflux system membrane protein CusA/SilA
MTGVVPWGFPRRFGGYVEQAKRAITERLKLPAGYTLLWTGQYEFQVRARERFKILIPLVLNRSMTIRVVWAAIAGVCSDFIGIPFAPRAAVEASDVMSRDGRQAGEPGSTR